ncbi:hypothetical protein KC622_01475 [Candidatus Dojkabacteria bacterium]|uniref:Uncharacterized protein n=1 Tax=Candidatus Dojkabacteria bacterium TaxID=2099670 RepID=A0A955HXS4_9BACT|nr:hypothetical protein [Candidatus Dojkabacteria bacterium]
MHSTSELPYTHSNAEVATSIYDLYGGHLSNDDPLCAYRRYTNQEVIDFCNYMEDYFDLAEKRGRSLTEALSDSIEGIHRGLFLLSEGNTFGERVLSAEDFNDDRPVPENYTVNRYVNSGKFPKLASIWSRLTDQDYITDSVRPSLLESFQKRREELTRSIQEYSEHPEYYKEKAGESLEPELSIIEKSISLLSERVAPRNPGNV